MLAKTEELQDMEDSSGDSLGIVSSMPATPNIGDKEELRTSPHHPKLVIVPWVQGKLHKPAAEVTFPK